MKQVKNVLISVYDKTGLDGLIGELQKGNVNIYSTGGTAAYIENLGVRVNQVESLTDYPSILGGRVKTLHPKVFGGILQRGHLAEDQEVLEQYEIPAFDMVVVDLYPFEQTVADGGSHEAIIEKIDIGGIALIRAASKNFREVLVVSSASQYGAVADLLCSQNGSISPEDRKKYAIEGFQVSSHYDTAIFNWMGNGQVVDVFKESIPSKMSLRYGENPHQEGAFYGDFNELFEQHHGKQLSYNNLLDIDAAVLLMQDLCTYSEKPSFAVLKHNNACGVAIRDTVVDAYEAALAGDPVSAFGGILISSHEIDGVAGNKIHELFCEIVIAPKYSEAAMTELKRKKNRVLLTLKKGALPTRQYRSLLNGVLVQDRDVKVTKAEDFNCVTKKQVARGRVSDLSLAEILVKHTKSNGIVLVKDGQLLSSGVGQTSRVDALEQAIVKAMKFGFDITDAVMASDAFFPFPDCVEIASNVGVKTVLQPGGSIKDQLSIDFCDEMGVAMVFTGTRHFKH